MRLFSHLVVIAVTSLVLCHSEGTIIEPGSTQSQLESNCGNAERYSPCLCIAMVTGNTVLGFNLDRINFREDLISQIAHFVSHISRENINFPQSGHLRHFTASGPWKIWQNFTHLVSENAK